MNNEQFIIPIILNKNFILYKKNDNRRFKKNRLYYF